MLKTRILAPMCLAFIGVAFGASPPAFIHYQGVLRDSNDAPLSGSYNMMFRFFNADTGGDEILSDLLGELVVATCRHG